jgi:acyl-CoA reductase-like NAD-dependent aldehyde dehydrogenase
MIILDDVDVDYAVRMATFGSFFHQGQICLNTRKIIVQRGIYDEFLEKFVARTKTLPSGDPLDPGTIIGPLVTQAAVDLIDERVKQAVELGATVRTGGTHEGLVYQPTILTDVPYEAVADQRGDLRAAGHRRAGGHPGGGRRVANRVQYGLTSSILTGDTYRASSWRRRCCTASSTSTRRPSTTRSTRRWAGCATAAGAAPARTASPTSPT